MKTFLLLLLISTQVFAQSTAQAPSAPVSQAAVSSFSFKSIKAKFKINYFSETLGPSINKWDDNEIGDNGTKQPEPTTMYHSPTVRFSLIENLSLFLNPRFSTVFGDRNDIRANSDPHVLQMGDWRMGFYYGVINKPKFNYAQILTHRAPYSTKSRNENIDSQIEWTHQATLSLAPALRLLHWTNFRYYEFNEDSTIERHRINWRTILNYSFNDKWNAQLGYEFDLQHRNSNDSSNPKHRDFSFMKRYHSYTNIGIGYSPIADLTIMPFIRSVDERNIRNETTIVGLWLLGKVL